MAYVVEDEVDWSDGTIDEPPSTSPGISGDSGCVSPAVHEDDGLDYLFEPPEELKPLEEYQFDVPLGTDLPLAPEHPALTRAQRARIGVRLNRRQPSEQDYAHFALYQANQKAYEATFLKHFVNHALQPSQIEQCFQQGTDAALTVQKYIASVSANVNGIANKMTWNAHCRTVNLLANAGEDGAPFWDVGSFDRALFTDFDLSNTTLVAHKMSESWHRMASNPSMVRHTTKDFPIGHHSSPLEEIDEVADTLFNRETFGSSMPPGRTVKQPSKRRARGRGLPGASIRDGTECTRRDNWLTTLLSPAVVQEHRETSLKLDDPGHISAAIELRSLDDLRQSQDHDPARDYTTATPLLREAPQPSIELSPADPTQLEQLFDRFGADALSGHYTANNTTPSQEQIDQVPTWPTRLLDDHKRRLIQRSPQVFRRALPGIRAVVAEAIQRGYHPVDPDFEDLTVNIESRERSEAAPAEVPEEDREVARTKEAVESSIQESLHGKKRKRQQPAAIRMFNKPIEPSKKRRKADASILSTAIPSVLSGYTDKPRKQKITTSVSFTSTPKIPKSAKRKPSDHAPAAPISQTPRPPHPSGSTTLEPHQHLPSGAYFTPKSLSERLVWRCGIKHAMGHYYNAGDRKNCPGCFTALSDNISALTMDFYLPSRKHYHQPNPTSSWRPSKPFGTTYGRARRSKHLSHNSIAKEAYWAAIDESANSDEARKLAIDAVLQHLAPKPPPREPTPAPSPSPEPDPGPHPSGSTTMEHNQDIPHCAYFQKRERHDDFAWRCDINHALGRYYLAGDKRSCPGCGSNRGGLGRHAVMDFYLPAGVCVRQEMASCGWKPRKPYKTREGRDPAKKRSAESTHNQIASRKYREAVGAGKSPEAALVWAVAETDRWLDGREDGVARRAVARETSAMVKGGRGEGNMRRARGARSDQTHPTSSTALNAARARNRAVSAHSSDNDQDVDDQDMGDEDMDDENWNDADHEMDNAAPIAQVENPSSNDETSSGSDSE